jgi:predicted secreted protein
MFTDNRSKRIVLVSHCILNQNSISDGTADYPGVNEDLLGFLTQSGVGIIQMPCPELSCLGLDRGDIHGGDRAVIVENTRIRQNLVKPYCIEVLNRLVAQIIFQIEEYIKNGFTIVGIIGINRSPSCGVDTTSKHDQEVEGAGVFIEILREQLTNKGLNIKMIGIKATETDKALKSVQALTAEC